MFKCRRFNRSHKVPLMGSMSVIETEHATVVDCSYMRKQKSKVVADDLVILIDPDFFAKDAYPLPAAEASFVVGILPQAGLSAHDE